MDPIIAKQRIAALLLKGRIDELNESEREEVAAWIQSSQRNARTYRLLREKDFTEWLACYRKIDSVRGLENYHKRYMRKARRLSTRWYWVAAVVVLMLGIASGLFFRPAEEKAAPMGIVPGSSKAMLVLNNGEVISLSAESNTEILATEALSVRSEGAQLRYTASEEPESRPVTVYNELVIPKGSDFTLHLADGTTVWLNAQSKIKYPVVFHDSIRRVYLEGEAYFEVAKDARHPFHVHTRRGVDIEVLGTSFNVRSYADEESVETVLEEGSVRMSRGNESVVLEPGHKATCLPDVAIQLTRVNTECYTAWRRGQYVFMNESVENIMRQLSRWYDIEVFYSNEAVKSVLFSGDVRKYDSIYTLLEAMEIAGGIHFSINGRTLIISGME